MIRPTSLDAYHQNKAKFGRQSQKIMDTIAVVTRSRLYADLTLKEIAHITDIEINAVSGRVNGLKNRGALIECPKRKCSITGNTVTPVRLPDAQQVAA